MICRARTAFVHLALVAMVLRALLPAGWMPNPGAGAPLVICSVHGTLFTDSRPGSAKHAPAQDDSHRQDVCPFAAGAHLATPGGAAMLALPQRFASIAANTPATAAISAREMFSRQSPRAPPAFV
jgi:hypothetical protein